jgi:protein tyrosine/serine phosphatase
MAIEPRSPVSPGIYRSGQPSTDQFYDFRATGGQTVIRLNDDGSMSPDFEKATIEGMGLKYIYIPLPSWRAPDHVTVAGILSILKDTAEQPVLLHCYHGEDRTGTIVACLRLEEGWTVDAALKEAKAHHMSWISFPMRRFIRNWAKTKA